MNDFYITKVAIDGNESVEINYGLSKILECL